MPARDLVALNRSPPQHVAPLLDLHAPLQPAPVQMLEMSEDEMQDMFMQVAMSQLPPPVAPQEDVSAWLTDEYLARHFGGAAELDMSAVRTLTRMPSSPRAPTLPGLDTSPPPATTHQPVVAPPPGPDDIVVGCFKAAVDGHKGEFDSPYIPHAKKKGCYLRLSPNVFKPYADVVALAAAKWGRLPRRRENHDALDAPNQSDTVCRFGTADSGFYIDVAWADPTEDRIKILRPKDSTKGATSFYPIKKENEQYLYLPIPLLYDKDSNRWGQQKEAYGIWMALTLYHRDAATGAVVHCQQSYLFHVYRTQSSSLHQPTRTRTKPANNIATSARASVM
jgi:hypothetical protein